MNHYRALEKFKAQYENGALPSVFAPSVETMAYSIKDRDARTALKAHVEENELSLLNLKIFLTESFCILHEREYSVLSRVFFNSDDSDRHASEQFLVSIKRSIKCWTDPVRRAACDYAYSENEPALKRRKRV